VNKKEVFDDVKNEIGIKMNGEELTD